MSLPFSITSRQALETVAGSTQASRVIPLESCSELELAIVTRLEEPLNDNADPYLPALDQVAPEIVPPLPLPEASLTVVPDPSSKA